MSETNISESGAVDLVDGAHELTRTFTEDMITKCIGGHAVDTIVMTVRPNEELLLLDSKKQQLMAY
jgi:hypothetical protein